MLELNNSCNSIIGFQIEHKSSVRQFFNINAGKMPAFNLLSDKNISFI